MEKAIYKAIDGGWKPEGVKELTPYGVMDKYDGGWGKNFYVILLDPTFWQCLGKAEGWEQLICGRCGGDLTRETSALNGSRLCINSDCWDTGLSVESARYHCKSLIDNLFDGGNVDDFFNNLLK